jgi:hypothetical protein
MTRKVVARVAAKLGRCENLNRINQFNLLIRLVDCAIICDYHQTETLLWFIKRFISLNLKTASTYQVLTYAAWSPFLVNFFIVSLFIIKA